MEKYHDQARQSQTRMIDFRVETVAVPAAVAFGPIRRIGGTTGWYYANWLWRLRGLLDSLVGGVGLARGRSDPETLSAGDILDFWRVESFDADHLLRLSSEMKLPGRAWLEFEVKALDDSTSIIRQTAIFDPSGLAGLAYWFTLWPIHRLVFAGMLRRIARAGCRDQQRPKGTK
jgi:hypothetical protein